MGRTGGEMSKCEQRHPGIPRRVNSRGVCRECNNIYWKGRRDAKKAAAVPKSMARKFWLSVDKRGRSECWPWLGYIKKSGHGLTTFRGVITHASRKAWLISKGAIPADLCVLHKCGVAACCNPNHMYLGTRKDNSHDRWGRRRYRVGGGKVAIRQGDSQPRLDAD